MTGQLDPMFDDRVADWLEEDPDRAPAELLQTVLAAMPSIPQRRPWRPGSLFRLLPAARFGFAVIVVAVVSLVALSLLRAPAIGPPGPSQPVTLSQRIDVSQHYYAAALPADWEAIIGPGVSQLDVFRGPQGIITVAYIPIPRGTSQDAWSDMYIEQEVAKLGGACLSVPAPAPSRIGSEAGWVYALPCLPGWMAMTAVGDRGYDIRFSMPAGRQPTAAAKGLFDAVLLQLSLSQAPTASIDPVEFTSELYGYSFVYPSGWEVRPADHALVGTEIPWDSSTAIDHFGSPSGDDSIIVASTEMPLATSLASWTDRTAVAVCGSPTTSTDLEVGGEPARLSTYATCFGAFHLWVTVLHARRAYHIVWLGNPGTEAFDRQLFSQILVSFRFPDTGPAPTAP
jgi:hypothetical protein